MPKGKMKTTSHLFEAAYGHAPPTLLERLYADRAIMESAPLRFDMPLRPFIIEIQYFRFLTDLVAEDVRHQRFAFAVNSDGFDMLIDLADDHLRILQREFSDIDSLGVTLDELLVSPYQRIG